MKINACLTSFASFIVAVLTTAPMASADVTYRITVETGTLNNAGTDANVFITLGSGPVPTDVAGCEAFPEQQLVARGIGDFERGQTDIFSVSDRELGDVPWICLRHEQPANRPGWFVNTVTVQREDTSQRWRFLVFQWLKDKLPDFRVSVIVPVEAPLNRLAETILLPYQASSYNFQIIPQDATPPSGFEQWAFNTTDFHSGRAAFGSGGDCALQQTVQTPWPPLSQLVLRQHVSIPAEATNVRIMAAVDNDIAGVFFNGTRISDYVSHENCPSRDEFRFDVPESAITSVPGRSLVAFDVLDRGFQSFFDMSVLADLPVLPALPRTSECPSYRGFGAPACPWDLVPLKPDDPSSWFDDNNFLLNPQWKWQQLATVENILGVGVPEFAIGLVWSSQVTGYDDSTWCSGHANLSDVTYTGKLRWDGHDHPFGDDDYNILIEGPRVSDQSGLLDFVAGGTLHNRDAIKGEFEAGETIDNFSSSRWWSRFHTAVDNGAGSVINGHDGVMTGLMGFDYFHPPASEIHPVHALAIRMAIEPNPADDAWAFFVRNWGNEGFCGGSQHYIHRGGIAGGVQGGQLTGPIDTRISIRIPHPEGMASARFGLPGKFRGGRNGIAPPGIDLRMAPNGDAIVTFLLNVPTEESYKFGELHLVWAPGASPVPRATAANNTVQSVNQSASAQFESLAAAEEDEDSDESAQRRAVYNALSPEQQQDVQARIEAALPRGPGAPALADDIELDTEKDVGEPDAKSEGQVVFTAPEQRTEQILRVGLAALCAVTGGVTPQAPGLCQESDIVTPFVDLVPIRSTFKTTSETAGCPVGFVGQFSFTARLVNKCGSTSLSDLRARVAIISGGNLLQNADGRAGGEGSTLTVPQENALSDRLLSPQEFVDFPVTVCLKKKEPFSFFVDILGVTHEGLEGDALVSTGRPRHTKDGEGSAKPFGQVYRPD